MARPKSSTPSYARHQSGRARVRWTDDAGVRHEQLMPGPFNSEESLAAYARFQLQLLEAPHGANCPNPNGMSVNELLDAYRIYAEHHYRGPTGESSGEVERIRAAVRPVRELFGLTPAAAFGPQRLKLVRQKYVIIGWCRRSINQQVERIRRIYKWAASEELIPAAVYQALTTVTGLQRGRTPAAESEPVCPVENAVVDATLPHLNRHVRGLVEFQRLTGCRPGEACRVRRSEIDTGGDIWLFRPSQHKGSWRGKDRIIPIGPKAQELIREYFTPHIADYLFSPSRAVEEVRADRAAKRVTPRYPSHMRRNAAKRVTEPQRTPTGRYTTRSYSVAVARACNRANLTRWHPNQLRHTFATMVRKSHGLEAAQVLLGHSRADVTQVYAERNESLAATVAALVG